MDQDKIKKHLNHAIENQVPDVWDKIEQNIQDSELNHDHRKGFMETPVEISNKHRSRSFTKRLSAVAAILFVGYLTFSFTPVGAAIQEIYDQLFTSNHIDDSGVKSAIEQGIGQELDETYYDQELDITVNFEGVMIDDKETKLLLTYQSESTDLENYYLDIFEGVSSVHLTVGNEQRKLENVGWGSRYYGSEENKVVEALSFESIKEFSGQNIHLEVMNITVYEANKVESLETVWPVEFTVDKSAILDRQTVVVNEEFSFEGETYTLKSVEFSPLETRVVVTGSDIKLHTDEQGNPYRIMSKLEHQYLNARNIDKEEGYTVDYSKSGVFLTVAGEKVDPVFSKGEVEGAEDEYIMTFAPVGSHEDLVLEIGSDIKIEIKE